MNKNTSELWDALWEDPSYRSSDLYHLNKENFGIRWKRIEKKILDEYGSFDGLQIAEVGSGVGKVAALCAKRGANVSLIDYSSGALNRSAEFYSRLGIRAEMKQMDVLTVPQDMAECFDVVMSFGLTEHFTGQERIHSNRSHFQLVRPGGLVFIAVPNRYNPPYRLYKAIAELTGTWRYGEEYPYSRSEFKRICESIGVRNYDFTGDSFWDSFRFLNPLGNFRKAFGFNPRYETGTFLDAYISYSLVLVAKKPIDTPIL